MAEFIPTGIGGFINRPNTKTTAITKKSQERSYDKQEYLPPPRPKRNFIPPQEAIDVLVERAIAALKKGIYWDRGSIINIVL